MLSAAGSVLVAGNIIKDDDMALEIARVRALRKFYFDRKLIDIGHEIDIPKIFALEMRASNKVEIIEAKPPEVVAKPDEKPVEEPKRPILKRGESNAT